MLADASGKLTHFFSVVLQHDLVNDINKSGRKTVIFELELFANLCAVICWRQFVTSSSIVIFTDNDAVRDCLISCNTSSGNARPILDLHLKVEYEASFNAWMSRVPTDSKIADDHDPSRGECESVWSDVQEFQVHGGAMISNAVPHLDKKLCEWSTARV